jgi:hypothetical protein
MKTIPRIFPACILSVVMVCGNAFGQVKGVDTQTQKIKEDTNKAVARPNDATRSFNWERVKRRFVTDCLTPTG